MSCFLPSRARRAGLLFAPVVAIAAMAALSGCEHPAEPCDVCLPDEQCYAGRCIRVTSCTRDSDCRPGHRCQPYRYIGELFGQGPAEPDMGTPAAAAGGVGGDGGAFAVDMSAGSSDGGSDGGSDGRLPQACSFVCDSTLCPSRSECIGTGDDAECLTVDCGRVVRCPGGKFCDLFVNTCYPTSGDCATDAACPRFDGVYPPGVVTRCVDGFCRVVRVPDTVPELSAPAPLAVYSPSRSQVFGSQAQVEFRFAAPDASVLALVLRALPKNLADVPAQALWGVALPAGHAPVARLADGVAIVGGVWQEMTTALPQDTLLYFFVQAVSPGALVAASDLIPFRVGGAWPSQKPGDPCTTGCLNLDLPLVCGDGRCLLLCGSNRDCLPFGLACGPPGSSSAVPQRRCQ